MLLPQILTKLAAERLSFLLVHPPAGPHNQQDQAIFPFSSPYADHLLVPGVSRLVREVLTANVLDKIRRTIRCEDRAATDSLDLPPAFDGFDWDRCDREVARMRRLQDRRRISEPVNLVKSAELIALEQDLDAMT